MLLPLDCHTAETGELVNGGRSPFILTVDMGGRLCYSTQKSPLIIFRISKGKFQPMYKKFIYQLGHFAEKNQRHKNPCQRGTNYIAKYSVQLGQNFKNSVFVNGCYHKNSQKSRSFSENFQIVISFFEKMWYNISAKQS